MVLITKGFQRCLPNERAMTDGNPCEILSWSLLDRTVARWLCDRTPRRFSVKFTRHVVMQDVTIISRRDGLKSPRHFLGVISTQASAFLTSINYTLKRPVVSSGWLAPAFYTPGLGWAPFVLMLKRTMISQKSLSNHSKIILKSLSRRSPLNTSPYGISYTIKNHFSVSKITFRLPKSL